MVKLNTTGKTQELLEALLKVLQEAVDAEPQAEPQAEPEKPVYKRWRAEEKGKYYYLDDFGGVVFSLEEYDSIDDSRYDLGNYFQLKAPAQAYHKHMLYTQKLRDAAKQSWLDAGEVIDWSNLNQPKSHAAWDFMEGGVCVYCMYRMIAPNVPYFATKESCRNAHITILGDDLKWYMTYEHGGV